MTKQNEGKIERIKTLLRNFGVNLLELEECHRWNSPINVKDLPILQSEQKKIAIEIYQIATDLKEEGLPIDNIIKIFSKEISKNVSFPSVSGTIKKADNRYYYRIWRDILRGNISKYI